MVRESIFNIIEHSNLFENKVLSSSVLDLYSGSGSFGLECLSRNSNKVIFILAPIITMTLALIAWAVIPFGEDQVLANINVGILYIFAVSSLGVYGIIMGGWASNSKYPFLGSIRSAAQMVSYEVSIGVIIINVLLCVGSLNLTDIVLAQKNMWYVIPLFPMFVIFFISALVISC